MKELLSYILENILGDKKIFKVKSENIDGIENLNVISSKDYIGRIIGKNGKIINSIKNILKIKAIKEGKRINIQITEQE